MLQGASDSDPPETRTLASLEYDYLKHLTTLSLIGVGGVVTFAGSIFADIPDKSGLAYAAVLFFFAAAFALWGQDKLLAALRRRRPPPRQIAFARYVAVAGIGLGAGMMLAYAYRALA